MAQIRIWRLGSLEHRIMPTPESINALAGELAKRDPKKDFDLVWGADLDVMKIDTDSDHEYDYIISAYVDKGHNIPKKITKPKRK